MKHMDEDVFKALMGLLAIVVFTVLITLALAEHEELSAKEWANMYYEQQEAIENAKNDLKYCDGDFKSLSDCVWSAKHELEQL